MRARLVEVLAAWILLGALTAFPESGPQPAVTIDLKTFGMAADLFAKPSESRDQARGLLNLFWLGSDRLVAAFSTSPRYTKSNHPIPLQVRLVIFDIEGKQQATKDWTFSAEGPEGDTTLDVEPGPDKTILAIHVSASAAPGLPEGNQLQVLSSEAKLLQNFYIPSDSVMLPVPPPVTSLVLQQFVDADRTALRFFTGRPLKSHLIIQFPRRTETLVGPNEAARVVCSDPTTCPTVRVFKADGTSWGYTETPHLIPHPRAFLNPNTLLVEVEVPEKANKLLLLHSDGSRSDVPSLKSTDSIGSVAGVATDGSRFAIDTYGENGVCGFLDFACSQHAKSLVMEVAGGTAVRVIFEKSLSSQGGKSSLSPDGKRLAVLDRGKVLLFPLP
jgi:hypothetical protein